jgi:hypothetical protein
MSEHTGRTIKLCIARPSGTGFIQLTSVWWTNIIFWDTVRFRVNIIGTECSEKMALLSNGRIAWGLHFVWFYFPSVSLSGHARWGIIFNMVRWDSLSTPWIAWSRGVIGFSAFSFISFVLMLINKSVGICVCVNSCAVRARSSPSLCVSKHGE